MANRSAPLDTLDEDFPPYEPPVNGTQEPSASSPQQPPAPEEGLDPGRLFPTPGESVDREEWRSRRDAWDHRTYNPEFHLGVDRKNADGTFKSRRAPQQGTAYTQASGKIKAGPARPLPVSTIEAFIMSVTALTSAALQAPELKHDKDDANNLAVPLAKVAALHDMKVDPRTEAYGMLIIALIAVEGPKFAAWFERLKAERARNVTPGKHPAPATQRPPPGAPPGTFGATIATMQPTPKPEIRPGEPQTQEGKGAPPMAAEAITKLFGD